MECKRESRAVKEKPPVEFASDHQAKGSDRAEVRQRTSFVGVSKVRGVHYRADDAGQIFEARHTAQAMRREHEDGNMQR